MFKYSCLDRNGGSCMDKLIKRSGAAFVLLKGMAISWLMTMLVLLILSALLVNTGLPSGAAGGFLIAAYLLSPFAGGFYIGKKAEQKKFLWGLVFGILYFVVFCLISMAVNPSGAFSMTRIIKLFLLQSAGGMAGGMLS